MSVYHALDRIDMATETGRLLIGRFLVAGIKIVCFPDEVVFYCLPPPIVVCLSATHRYSHRFRRSFYHGRRWQCIRTIGQRRAQHCPSIARSCCSFSLQTLAICISLLPPSKPIIPVRKHLVVTKHSDPKLRNPRTRRSHPGSYLQRSTIMASHHVKQFDSAEFEEGEMMSICKPSPQPLSDNPLIVWIEQRLANRKQPTSPTKDVVGRRQWRKTHRHLRSHPVFPAQAAEAAESMAMDWEPTEIVAAHKNITLRSPAKRKLVSPSKQGVWWKSAALREPFVAPKPSRPFEPTEIDPWMMNPDLDMPHSAFKANNSEYIVQAERALEAADTIKYPCTPRGALSFTLFHNPQASLPLFWNGPRPGPRPQDCADAFGV